MASKQGKFKGTAAEFFISGAEEAAQDPAPIRQATEDADGALVPEGYKLVKDNKTDRTHLLMRPKIKEGMKKAASERGVSMNDLFDTIAEDFLKKEGKL